MLGDSATHVTEMQQLLKHLLTYTVAGKDNTDETRRSNQSTLQMQEQDYLV